MKLDQIGKFYFRMFTFERHPFISVGININQYKEGDSVLVIPHKANAMFLKQIQTGI